MDWKTQQQPDVLGRSCGYQLCNHPNRRVRGTFQSLIMDACWKGVMFVNKMLSIITERERMYGVIQKPLTEI